MNPFLPKATTNAAGNWFLWEIAEIASRVNFEAMVVRTISCETISSSVFVYLDPGDTRYVSKI